MRRAIVLAAIAALVLPVTASAKEIAALTVCGSDGCKRITTHAALQGFMNGGYETLAPGQVLALESAAVAELALNGMRASTHGAIRERALNDQACQVMVAAEQSVGQIAGGLAAVATRNGLARRRALEIGVKAVVQACPFFLGDLRRSLGRLRRL